MVDETQYAHVWARTFTADYVDIYGKHGSILSTYKPTAVGEQGFMELSLARAAETAGDVFVSTDNSPITIVEGGGYPRDPITAVASAIPGAIDLPVTISVGGGPAGQVYTIDIDTATDSGEVDSQDVAVAVNDTANEIAAAIDALTIPGITTAVVGPVVTLTPGAGTEITTCTVTVT